MVKAIKDFSKLAVALLKIGLFFLPIIALISGLTGVMGMMMNMDDPAIEMGQMGEPVGNEIIVPFNYSISNPTNFDLQDYQFRLGMVINDTINDEIITIWSTAFLIGDIPVDETVEGMNETVTITLPETIDFETNTFNVTMMMGLSFNTALGLANMDLQVSMMTMEMGPDAQGGDH